jgi:two-component system nitrogen regulation sensor histidine kinase NtrY
MFKIIKNFNSLIVLSFICIFLGMLTFLTFLNRGFLAFSENSLQILLIIDILLLVIFFILITINTYRLFNIKKKKKIGDKTNFKYVSLFSLFTFLPSLLIAIFSLFLFNYGLQNYFNSQITKAVNNSYDVSKNYFEENKKTIEADAFLMSVGINRVSNLFYSNLERFNNIVRSEKILRRVDEVYLIDSVGNLIFSENINNNKFIKPTEKDFDDALQGVPIILTNEEADKTSVIIKLSSLIDTYLYISRFIDPEITRYLSESEEAINFYYTVENNQLGIKITFAIIYIIVVTLLLFLSTVIAISFAKKFTKPIINLITASENISKGILDSKVPYIKTDEEFEILNNNFNTMIDRLKKQQDKLLISERYSAWESVARKLAHEIKNPLTPIQLSIDRLQEKYYKVIPRGKEGFKKYLETINRQIKDIEKLVNEFSSFARMPRPVFKRIDIEEVLNRAIDFYKMSSLNLIKFKNISNKKLTAQGDEEQLYRVFINLIKNSEESILEKKKKNQQFKGIIDVEIANNNDYIAIKLQDNGVGNVDTSKIMTPYFTTKENGTGLGLPIVSKIINEHFGDFLIKNLNEGVVISINLPLSK